MLTRIVISMLLLWTTPAVAAAQQPVLASGFHRLQQVAVTTSDLDRSVAFYRDTLGLTLMFVTTTWPSSTWRARGS